MGHWPHPLNLWNNTCPGLSLAPPPPVRNEALLWMSVFSAGKGTGQTEQPSLWLVPGGCGAAWRVLGVSAAETSLSPSGLLISRAPGAGRGPVLRGDRQMRTQSLALVMTPEIPRGLFPSESGSHCCQSSTPMWLSRGTVQGTHGILDSAGG